MAIAIETKGLTKVFSPNILAVNQLNLSIKEGEIFAFLGPNGAGKTTTVRLLTTLIEPTSGDAVIAGSSILKEKIELRRNIGLLSERPNLYLRLSARKNLLFFAKMYGLTHQEASRRIDEMSRQFELKDRIDSPVGSYSKGMKQKLGILRAMIHSPPVMFLDEPTSGLDPLAQASVRETIERAAEELDTTIFMTTHNLPEAERLADKIGVINRGELLVIGSTSELQSKVSKTNKLVIKCIEPVSNYQSLFQNIEGVLSVRCHKNENAFDIELTNFNEVTPHIIRSLVERDISILEVRPTKKSLEEIYKQIMDNSYGGWFENAA
ncbi:MAG: ABC transporter ATP-binding protein [Candidatus Heimdallarchaeota archaeon]|nr:MAG: ABC transporter ATP-binding protein [Candidatus Heimdallarchaeota archaeon]